MSRRLSCITLLLTGAVAFADTPADKTAAPADATTASVAALGDQAQSMENKPVENKTVANKSGGKSAKSGSDAKTLSGMSILGNQEAPKALVIVPWKSSKLGEEVGLSKALDDGRQPVDKDVFMRELEYYEIRSGEK
jgi:hypothetical protein